MQLDNRALNLAGPGSLEEIAEHEDDDDQNSGYKTGKKTRMYQEEGSFIDSTVYEGETNRGGGESKSIGSGDASEMTHVQNGYKGNIAESCRESVTLMSQQVPGNIRKGKTSQGSVIEVQVEEDMDDDLNAPLEPFNPPNMFASVLVEND